MRITKGQLRKLIIESILAESLWKNIHAKKARGEKSNPRSKSYKAAKKAGEKINKDESSKHDPDYKPGQKSVGGMTRGEALDKTKEDLASGDPERKARAYRRRERMEKQAAAKMSEISAAHEKSLKKKAKEKNAPLGALKQIYKKGEGAWGTSGSKPGQSQAAWAMARVNSVLSGGPARKVDDAQWKLIQKHRKKKRKNENLDEYVEGINREAIDEYDVVNEQDIKEFKEFMEQMHETQGELTEAEYRGRKVKLNKPMQGDIKKFKVYVKNPKGNVVKVNFGHGGKSAKGKAMRIRKNNPKARKSFRARHNCDSPGPRHKARYWSCRKW